ncbi:hypothetical protein H5410_042211 [Solanum commersonii]|uniref:Uncharacterized protein n=1 Tax=Solanum commersonii TaxID=4109 RepID=A0A9J5XU39_SOLCO|nr:hypothetical protein H5410_042211 [Solanum commersonii]
MNPRSIHGFLVIRNSDVLMSKPAHFQGQTSPRVGKPFFLLIFHILAIDPIGPQGQTKPFSRLNEPQSR